MGGSRAPPPHPEPGAGVIGGRAGPKRSRSTTRRPRTPDEPFAPVRRAVAALAGLTRPWFVVGAWAIDLHLGGVAREHGDVDVTVYGQDQAAVHPGLTDRFSPTARPSAGSAAD